MDTTKPPTAALSPRERWQQQNDEANKRLNKLAGETTQREWLLITTALDRTRQQIGADNGLTMLAMAWVHEKRAHGGASWDRLLDMTDDQLAELHGYPPGDGSDLSSSVETPPAPNADQIANEAIAKPLHSPENGADTSTTAQASSTTPEPAPSEQ
jgi:hypothetical protein